MLFYLKIKTLFLAFELFICVIKLICKVSLLSNTPFELKLIAMRPYNELSSVGKSIFFFIITMCLYSLIWFSINIFYYKNVIGWHIIRPSLFTGAIIGFIATFISSYLEKHPTLFQPNEKTESSLETSIYKTIIDIPDEFQKEEEASLDQASKNKKVTPQKEEKIPLTTFPKPPPPEQLNITEDELEELQQLVISNDFKTAIKQLNTFIHKTPISKREWKHIQTSYQQLKSHQRKHILSNEEIGRHKRQLAEDLFDVIEEIEDFIYLMNIPNVKKPTALKNLNHNP